MTVVVWVVEGTWQSTVDAAREWLRADEECLLLHVTPMEVAASTHAAFAGLLGRSHPELDPGAAVEALSREAEADLLRSAGQRLGRPAAWERRTGRVEREVVAAAEGAGLLVVARDGDRSRLGPRSLGPATRFVVDHAPCPVLLVWPERAPDVSSLPPPPPR